MVILVVALTTYTNNYMEKQKIKGKIACFVNVVAQSTFFICHFNALALKSNLLMENLTFI